jgi:23S rRNA (uridine2552-2'-O)-methyltransferase
MTIRKRGQKVDRAWLKSHLSDPWVKLAQQQGYRARAAYKLIQIDEALGLLAPGQVVVDLGSAPGAWSQYLRRKLLVTPAAEIPSAASVVIALDILPMEPVEGVEFILGDFREESSATDVSRALAGRPVDVVLSDMAPNLSGIPASDGARMSHLLELAVDFAVAHLQPRGVLVAKAFHGSGYSQTVELFKSRFKLVKPIKPKASRDKSAETYLVGIGLKFPRTPD